MGNTHANKPTRKLDALKALDATQAAEVLRQGQILAYPTEAVYGLGCDPCNQDSVRQLLALKGRALAQGLILVAADVAQLGALWQDLDRPMRERLAASWPGPHTWLLPDQRGEIPTWIKGDHATVAVRVSAHPDIQALCNALGTWVISTSANPNGAIPARSHAEVWQYFPEVPIMAGTMGTLSQPTSIRDLCSGRVLR